MDAAGRREFNLSETAFTYREDDAWRLRWFTPAVEVDACGHATVAATHVLLDEGLANELVAFDTRSGRLTCWRDGDQIVMDWPADPCDRPVDADAVSDALGVPVRRAGAGRNYILAEVDGGERSGTQTLAGTPGLFGLYTCCCALCVHERSCSRRTEIAEVARYGAVAASVEHHRRRTGAGRS